MRDKTAPPSLAGRLQRRRKAAGMTVAQLAKRSGVSIATVNRVLAGNAGTSIAHVSAVADALGLSLQLRPVRRISSLRAREAIRKARQVVGLTHASAPLEKQGVPRAVARDVQKQVSRRLLKSGRKLWE
jgi:transcriptional regulator with XRE-family HTH domain